MKIEIVLPSLETGGMEVMVADLARALASRGHSVGITCIERDGALAERVRLEGIRVTLVPVPGVGTFLFPTDLVRWLRQLAPDVVHVHSGALLKATRAARLAGVPRVVLTVHGLEERTPWHARLEMRLAARLSDYCLAVSEPLRRFLVEQAGLDPTKLATLPNGIDTDKFALGPRNHDVLRRELGLGPKQLLIGIVARLTPLKNHALLLEAFASVATRVPEAALVLIGDGELRTALEAQAQSLGIQNRVLFAGERRVTAALYHELDLFVLSSLSEGTSISILEAMASGVCVVATAVGGNADLLDDGRAGTLVPSGNTPALASALTELLLDPALRNAYVGVARSRVELLYAHDRMVDRYEALYQGLEWPITPSLDVIATRTA